MVLAAAVCSLSGARAQELTAKGGKKRVMTLADCIKEGIENNYDVKLARLARDVADNNVTSAQFLPVVTANATQNQDRLTRRDHFTDTDMEKADYITNLVRGDVALSWRLFDGMNMFATRQTQKELLSQGELNLKNSMESLVADIAGQYYYLVTQLDRLKATKRYLEISTIRYNQALEKYNIGSISGLEMKQAKIDLNADSSTYVTRQMDIDNALVTLNQLMNSELSGKLVLCDTIIPNQELQLGDINSRAEEHNSMLLMARSGQRLAEFDLKSARSGRYPTLDFNSSYRLGRSSDTQLRPSYTNTNGLSWGFTASVKLFGGLETNRKIRNAKLGVQNNQLIYDQTLQNVRSNIQVQYNTYKKNLAMIAFETESADVALLNLEAAMEMYRLGSMSGVEFREIQRSYMQAVERNLDAIFQAKTTEINLLYLGGEILDYPGFTPQEE